MLLMKLESSKLVLFLSRRLNTDYVVFRHGVSMKNGSEKDIRVSEF